MHACCIGPDLVVTTQSLIGACPTACRVSPLATGEYSVVLYSTTSWRKPALRHHAFRTGSDARAYVGSDPTQPNEQLLIELMGGADPGLEKRTLPFPLLDQELARLPELQVLVGKLSQP